MTAVHYSCYTEVGDLKRQELKKYNYIMHLNK